MDASQVQTKYLIFGHSMYTEGYLDEQFTELQKLAEEDNNPRFVLEIIPVFFTDCQMLLHNLTHALDTPVLDFDRITEIVQTFRGVSASFGARRLKNVFNTFKACSDQENIPGCMMCLDKVKEEYADVKGRLEKLLYLQLQIKAAGGVVPMVE